MEDGKAADGPVHDDAAQFPDGLSSGEAASRLGRYGPNTIPEHHPSRMRAVLRKFWGTVPWMLEATLILELVLGKDVEAAVIAFLLLFNAGVSAVQERSAQNALELLKQKLAPSARVRRDHAWQTAGAATLVPGDIVHLRMGDFVPADCLVSSGQLALNQAMLTGESLSVDAQPGSAIWAGTTVERGEADARVVATGGATRFGKTASLVQTATTQSHLEETILRVVRVLLLIDVGLVALVLVYAVLRGVALTEVVPFGLILMVASIPVALPATFTLATALGSLELAGRGVLVTRLSAVEEAAAMDTLCSDKTGTLTENRLTLLGIAAVGPHTEDEVLQVGALASAAATQDPIDLAILAAQALKHGPDIGRALAFTPFDPATKRSEAVVQVEQARWRVLKGTPATICALSHTAEPAEVAALAARGARVLAVARQIDDSALELLGLIGLYDPPRQDSRALIERLAALGVRVIMVTGDTVETARAIAATLELQGPVCARDAVSADCAVVAGVYPEDKFTLVRTLQKSGHVTGMTGDGVNDAPALKQAEVGIAVQSATDVAKASASLVLTSVGLSGVVAAVEEGRRIYQRMLTYTLNKIIKTFQVALLLTLVFLLTRQFATTPRLILLLLVFNDFVTMSIASDRVGFSPSPDRWQVGQIAKGSLFLAILWLLFSFAVFYAGRLLHLGLPAVQTLVFLMLVFSGQSTVFLVRERGRFWRTAPGRWLILASVGDLVVVSLLARLGVLMHPLALHWIIALLGLTLVYTVLLDGLKVWYFQRLGLVRVDAERRSDGSRAAPA